MLIKIEKECNRLAKCDNAIEREETTILAIIKKQHTKVVVQTVPIKQHAGPALQYRMQVS